MDELSQYIQKQKKILLTLDKSIKQLTQSQTNDSKRLIVLRKELDIIEKIRPSIQGPPDFIHNLDSLLSQYRGELTQKEDELKTIFGLEYINKTYSYKHILRTNLSSFFILDNLIKLNKSLPEANLYAGVTTPHFISGAGFWMSKDIVEYILNNKNTLNYSVNDVEV